MSLKKGDLAIIKNSGIPENIGRIVECLELEHVPWANTEDKMMWKCYCATPLVGANSFGVRSKTNIFHTHDINLQPIKGISNDDVLEYDKQDEIGLKLR
jgi:hypothetical protein